MKVVDEFLAFSDLHAHNFKFGSRREEHYDTVKFPGLYNSRLLDAIGAIRYVNQYAKRHGVETVLFGGDLFHRRSIQHTDAYNLAVHELYGMAESGIQLIMIPGNHDYADRLGLTHTMQSIRHSKIEVCDTVQVVHGRKVVFVTVPYTDDLEEAKRRLERAGELADEFGVNRRAIGDVECPVVLLAHLGMQGAKVGSDYVLVADNDISVSDVPHQKFALCLFGHFHEHQRLFGNGWYIGATHQHNWGDCGGTRGFLHAQVFEDGSIDFKHLEIPNVPKFRKIETPEEDVEPTRAIDFVRVILDNVDDATIKALEKRMPNASFEVIKRVDNRDSRLTLTADQLDPEKALDAWVTEHPHETLSREALLRTGRELLRKAKGG